MPKRKFTDQDYEKLRKKLRKIKREVQRDKRSKRRQRILSVSSSSSSADESSSGRSQNNDRNRSETEPTNPEQNQGSDAQAASPAREAAATDEEPQTSPAPEAELNAATAEDSALELDTEILQILEVDPAQSELYGKDIQKDLAVRLEHTATIGLSKEDRKELMNKYLVPQNCKLVGALAFNPEIKAALSEAVIKRDAVIETKQKLMASAIASLGQAITSLLSSKEKSPELLQVLIDTGRTICDCQHNDTATRRNFIIFSVKKEMKESLQNAKVDTFLFGQNMSEILKAAKTTNKSGAELKPTPAPKPSTSRANLPSTSKNWRSFNPVRVAAAAPAASSKAKETSRAAPAARSQRGNYSRRSQGQRASYSRR